VNGLKNILFRGYLPRGQLGESLRIGDVHLITLRKNLAGVSVPCKLYGVMAAGRPALFVGPEESETSDDVKKNDCGRVVNNGDVDGLVATLLDLAGNQPLCDQLGSNGRRAFETTFNRATCSARWTELLEKIEKAS